MPCRRARRRTTRHRYGLRPRRAAVPGSLHAHRAPALADWLEGLAAEDGLLPVCTSWWPEEGPGEGGAGLFPDARVRREVEREQHRLPLSCFDAAVPSPPGWESAPAAYLGFGVTYAEEQAEARRRGWPAEVLPGGHLHMLADPPGGCAALHRLFEVTGITATGASGDPLDLRRD